MKKLMLLLVIACLCIIPVGCGDNIEPEKVDASTEQQEEQQNQEEQQQQEEEQEKEEPKTQVFNMGDTIKMDNLQFTVESVRTSKGSEFFEPDEGNKYLYIMAIVENVGSEEEAISSMMMFDLVSTDGMSYDIAIVSDSKGKVDGSLGAGRKMKGELVYQVPENEKEFELVIDSSLFDTGMAVIKIITEE